MPHSLAEVQRAFLAHAYGETEPALAELVSVPGNAAGLRVYGAGTRGKLWDALGAVFPVVSALVGERCFRALALRYAREEPSRSADIHAFGGQFAELLEVATELRELDYLADVARLEWAWHEAYHASDEAALDVAGLASVPPQQRERLRFRLARHARLLTCRYPADRIWAAHHSGSILTDSLVIEPACHRYLVVRPSTAPVVLTTSAANQAFLAALAQGRTLSDALDLSGAAAGALADWIAAGVVVQWFLDG